MAELIVEGDDLVDRGSHRWRSSGPFAGTCGSRCVRSATCAPSTISGPSCAGSARRGRELPGVITLGTRRGGGILDFAAVYGHRPGVVVDLKHATPFSRLVVSCRDAQDQDRMMHLVADAVNSRGQARP